MKDAEKLEILADQFLAAHGYAPDGRPLAEVAKAKAKSARAAGIRIVYTAMRGHSRRRR